MHCATHSWVQVPFTPSTKKPDVHPRESYHRSLCLEYPPRILSAKFHASNPACHSRDAAVTGPTALLLHIPGNPGCCQFYDRFASELLGSIPGLCLLVPSLAGFSLVTDPEHHHHKQPNHFPDDHRKLRLSGAAHHHHDDDNKNNNNKKTKTDHHQEEGGPYLLEDQKRFLYSFVESFVLPIIARFSIPKERVWVSGHSIGGYFSLHVVDHFRERNVFRRAVLLAPTIARMAESTNGVNMKNFLHIGKYFLPGVVNVVVKALVPSRVLHMFVDMVMGKELHACHLHTVRCLLHAPQVTSQALSLGSDEIARVNPLDVELIKRIEDRVIFYFVHHDDWVPDKVRQEVKETFPNLAGYHIGTDPLVTHAWCSRAYHQVAEFVAQEFHKDADGGASAKKATAAASSSSPGKKNQKVSKAQQVASAVPKRRQRGE